MDLMAAWPRLENGTSFFHSLKNKIGKQAVIKLALFSSTGAEIFFLCSQALRSK